MAGDFVNLNESGVLARSGQGYDGTAQDNDGEARAFSGRMDASRQGLIGGAGRVFSGVAEGHTSNLSRLAAHIADQAVRAVRTESSINTADADSESAQSTSATNVDTQMTALSKPITY